MYICPSEKFTLYIVILSGLPFSNASLAGDKRQIYIQIYSRWQGKNWGNFNGCTKTKNIVGKISRAVSGLFGGLFVNKVEEG